MPNDTDFSVVQRANIPGIDFAFAGERNHYHTPNDTIENLDLRTLQHHGENILPLARSLANSDWTSMGGQYVYGGKLYGVWTQWNSSYSFLLTVLAFVLIIVSLFRSKLNIIKVFTNNRFNTGFDTIFSTEYSVEYITAEPLNQSLTYHLYVHNILSEYVARSSTNLIVARLITCLLLLQYLFWCSWRLRQQPT